MATHLKQEEMKNNKEFSTPQAWRMEKQCVYAIYL